MKKLLEIIQQAENNKTAIGHFNVSDLAGLKAIFAVSQEASLALNGREAVPVIIGVSEGERDFIGVKQIAALVKSLRDEYDYPIYLNADHTRSLEKIKQAVEAGFDAVMFDGSEFPFEENIRKTKQAVEYVKSVSRETLVEAEIGIIKGSSAILSLSDSDRIKNGDLTVPEQALEFIKQTGVDLLAPAVGNVHGIIAGAEGNPALDIQRISEIKKAVSVPLVLHGGSGIKNEDFVLSIDAGVSIIHINTELRLAWRQGMDKALKENPNEIVPYKLLSIAIEEIKKVVEQRLKLFNRSI